MTRCACPFCVAKTSGEYGLWLCSAHWDAVPVAIRRAYTEKPIGERTAQAFLPLVHEAILAGYPERKRIWARYIPASERWDARPTWVSFSHA